MKKWTVQQVIDKILTDMCGGIQITPTCDIITAGSPDAEVRGVATTFMATFEVIREAVRQGKNFIITHEPTWFNGADETQWCEMDCVYQAKRNYLEKHGVTIWRLHDHMHMGSETDYIYVFRDIDENEKSRFNYQHSIGLGKSGYTSEGFEKYKEYFGVYVLQSNSAMTPEEIFSGYKKRWGIETFYQYLKNRGDYNDQSALD